MEGKKPRFVVGLFLALWGFAGIFLTAMFLHGAMLHTDLNNQNQLENQRRFAQQYRQVTLSPEMAAELAPHPLSPEELSKQQKTLQEKRLHPNFPRGGKMPIPLHVDPLTFSPRQQAVVEATKKAWEAYKAYAWGADDLDAIHQNGVNWNRFPARSSAGKEVASRFLRMAVGWFRNTEQAEEEGAGAGGGKPTSPGTKSLWMTPIDALDTLWIMGLREEFNEVVKELDQAGEKLFENNIEVSFFEITIRLLGGLLGGYEVSAAPVLLDRAYDLGQRLLYAFPETSEIVFNNQCPNVFPTPVLNLAKKEASFSPLWHEEGVMKLAEISSFQLEFRKLSHFTGDQRLARAADLVDKALLEPFTQRPRIKKKEKKGIVSGSGVPLITDLGDQNLQNNEVVKDEEGSARTSQRSEGGQARSSGDSKPRTHIGEGISNTHAAVAEEEGMLPEQKRPEDLRQQLWPAFLSRKAYCNDDYRNSKQGKLLPSLNNKRYTIGGNSDSFYEYVIKQWFFFRKTQPMYHSAFIQFHEGITTFLLKRLDDKHSFLDTVLVDNTSSRDTFTMDHLSCFAPGMFVLNAHLRLSDSTVGAEEREKGAANDLKVAAKVTRTCREMYAAHGTFLAPERTEFGFEQFPGGRSLISGWELSAKKSRAHHILRPEALEAFAYMKFSCLQREMNTTNAEDCEENGKEWEEAGWHVFQALLKLQLPNGGFAGVCDVRNASALDPTSSCRIPTLESFFFAETLKYAFLLFAPAANVHRTSSTTATFAELFNPELFVFTTEAHIFRVLPLSAVDL